MSLHNKNIHVNFCLSLLLGLAAACGTDQPNSTLSDSNSECAWPQGMGFDSFKPLCDHFSRKPTNSCSEHTRAFNTVNYLKGEYAKNHQGVSAASVTCEMMVQNFTGRHIDISGSSDLSVAMLATIPGVVKITAKNANIDDSSASNLTTVLNSLAFGRNLIDLDLSHNSMTNANLKMFSNPPELKRLNLSYNKIKNANQISISPKLEALDLSFNKDLIFAQGALSDPLELRKLLYLDVSATKQVIIDSSSPLLSRRYEGLAMLLANNVDEVVFKTNKRTFNVSTIGSKSVSINDQQGLVGSYFVDSSTSPATLTQLNAQISVEPMPAITAVKDTKNTKLVSFKFDQAFTVKWIIGDQDFSVEVPSNSVAAGWLDVYL